MSTWTSDLKTCAVAGVAALLALAGCIDGGGFGYAPSQMIVSQNSVVISGPPGFCIDRPASRDNADGAFVLMGSCAAIARSSKQPTPDVAAVLMASVSTPVAGKPVSESLDTLERFFTSEEGRAALSQTGHSDSVEVLDTLQRDKVFYIHARDASEGLASEVRDEYWRAFFDVKGRLVTASVFGTDERPFSSDAGRATLTEFVQQIRRRNTGDS
ncbi:hypothetical protein ACFFUT_14040 [Pseudohalocynthiibacter aestuariivivens]|jgi:hypothetical protein|uniref:Uncharacterized protein n=1 Tax=Pseudohalocynthiibacter aestuariivivens TaxID=1591409 RepID=A0ABV5JHH3_9RHOB|nr:MULTISPECIES: hypothetical protein [Pseudohalocynthiibacter]MBS9715389.1 hypothetical protein [Pseudohalocynthiibacter aestuariivivens]MCK0102665.1 hypothetical protein [Pseudohalocynthiibacter sp. F2068]